jgi:hypothetical protein
LLLLSSRPATGWAQTAAPVDKGDQEIELLKTEVKKLAQRVNALESLNEKVKSIDNQVAAQKQIEQTQSEVDRTKALDARKSG